MRIAVAGDPGSFSEEAGLLYAQRENLPPNLIFATDMAGVLRAVNEERAEIGVFPVVNSRGGLVQSAFHAMGEYSFAFIGEVWLEVQQCLMALPGTTIADITGITSHPQALAQCERYLARTFPGIPTQEWIDTARSAHDLAAGVLPKTHAVLAPARAAHLNGLELLARGVQDQHPNLTTFIVVTKRTKNPAA